MAREARKRSSTGYYHILLRGVNKQVIFYDDNDRAKMLDCLRRFQDETDVSLVAYCLMDNHIHILAHGEEEMGLFVQKLASSYVFYFNHKYERVGHLFQDRFKSEPVEDERYLLAVFRYILQNPWKAGISRPEEYAWSSWDSLTGGNMICDISVMLDVGDGKNNLKKFVEADSSETFMDVEDEARLSDAQAMEMMKKIIGGKSPQIIATYKKEACK